MEVSVKLFASVREMFQKDEIRVWVSDNCTLQELNHFIGKEHPNFKNLPGRWAVNLEFRSLDYKIKGNEEIAWIPPVSGG